MPVGKGKHDLNADSNKIGETVQTVTIDFRSQNREKKSGPGTRVCLRALVEGSSCISCSRKGRVGWCYVMGAHLRGGGATLHAVEQPVRPRVDHL